VPFRQRSCAPCSRRSPPTRNSRKPGLDRRLERRDPAQLYRCRRQLERGGAGVRRTEKGHQLPRARVGAEYDGHSCTRQESSPIVDRMWKHERETEAALHGSPFANNVCGRRACQASAVNFERPEARRIGTRDSHVGDRNCRRRGHWRCLPAVGPRVVRDSLTRGRGCDDEGKQRSQDGHANAPGIIDETSTTLVRVKRWCGDRRHPFTIASAHLWAVITQLRRNVPSRRRGTIYA
jgi:hypothetical protein